MDNSNGTPRSVAAALEEVAQWRSEAEERQKTELGEVDKEVENLQVAVANLQQQLEALAGFREELLGKAQRIADEEVQRSYDAIFAALRDQNQALAARSRLVDEARTASEEAVAAYMEENEEVAALVQEVEQFKASVEPTLDNLPASYRTVILAHHEGVVARLEEHMAAARSKPVAIEADELSLDVVYAVDAPEGAAELLMFVLPVDEAVHTGWFEREEDLQVHVAARVIEGLYRACHTQNLTGVQAIYGGHQGLLAVEVELPEDVAPDPLVEALDAHLGEALAAVEEIRATHLVPRPVRLAVDHLLPPEDAQEEEVNGV
jgi:uncharacterized protein YoxC